MKSRITISVDGFNEAVAEVGEEEAIREAQALLRGYADMLGKWGSRLGRRVFVTRDLETGRDDIQIIPDEES